MSDRLARRAAVITAALLLSACAGSRYQPQTLSGTVATTTPRSQPVIHVRLLDEPSLGRPAALLGEQIINRPRSQPAPFALQYDGTAIMPGKQYDLDIEIFASGELAERATETLTAGPTGLPAQQEIHTQPVGK